MIIDKIALLLLIIGVLLTALTVAACRTEKLTNETLFAALGATAGIAFNVVGEFVGGVITKVISGAELPAAMLAGACSGFVTAFLQTKLGVESILAGIIVNTGLYTVNLAVMGFSSNVPMLKTATIFTVAQSILGENAPYKLLVAALVTVVVLSLIHI